MNRTVTPEQAAKILADLAEAVGDRRTAAKNLARPYADQVLEAALANAAGRPTAQAPRVARELRVSLVSDGALIAGAGSPLDFGSEYGSTMYRQFGPRVDAGQWLAPAREAAGARAVLDGYLSDLLDRVLR